MNKREDMEKALTLYTVASIKAHDYAQDYNPHTGRVEDKPNYHALKQGFMDGFLAGVAHKLGGGHD
jgi:hypothetical protein